MNATPPPDNSLSDRNAVAPLPPSYPLRDLVDRHKARRAAMTPEERAADDAANAAPLYDSNISTKIDIGVQGYAPFDIAAYEEAIGRRLDADPGPCDREKMKRRLAERVELPPVIRLLANAKEDLKELNDRLAERTQAFLERERQLLDRLRLAEAALQGPLYAESDEAGNWTFTLLDRRVVGRTTPEGRMEPGLPYQGDIKIKYERPEN